MGYVGIRPPMMTTRRLEAKDLICLAGLGTAARQPATVDDVCMALDAIAGHLWTPVREVVANQLFDMVSEGAHLATHRSGRGEDVFAITSAGQKRLSFLLSCHVGRPFCNLGQVGLYLKLAFLDLVPPAERRAFLADAARVCEAELADRQRRCLAWAVDGAYGRMWREREIHRLHQDLAMLRTMADRLGCANASQSH